MKRECVAVEASVVVEAKLEREEISTSDIGPEFSIDFRQERGPDRQLRPVSSRV